MKTRNILFFILATIQTSFAQPNVFEAMNLTPGEKSFWSLNNQKVYSRENVKNLRAGFEYDESTESIKIHYCHKQIGDDSETISRCIEKDYITTLSYSKNEFLTRLDVYEDMQQINAAKEYLKGYELMNCAGKSNHYEKYNQDEINAFAKNNPEFQCVEKAAKFYAKEYIPQLIKKIDRATDFAQAIIENKDLSIINKLFLKYQDGFGDNFHADFITFPHLNFIQKCMQSNKAVIWGDCSCESSNKAFRTKKTLYNVFGDSWDVPSSETRRVTNLVNNATGEKHSYDKGKNLIYFYLNHHSHKKSLEFMKSCYENPKTELKQISNLLEGEDCNQDIILNDSKMSHISSELNKELLHRNSKNVKKEMTITREY